MRFLLLVMITALVARGERGRWERLRAGITRALAWRWTPAVVGVLWAAIIVWLWGGIHAPAVFHDELSYLFQARVFAMGRWSVPSPPLPDMFAQPHLLVVPVMASKYPPGHALLLSLGELAGSPALTVLALVALRAAVVFALARRLANGGVALATCMLLLKGDSLRWSASYFSQTTTAALLVVCWYALLRWREERSIRWIVILAAALGWCAITRPYSAMLFAIPIAAVVLYDVWRESRWRHFAIAMATGTAIVAILPLWSARTTGDAMLWPATVYTRDYMPYDHPHFGVDTATPRRERPVDLAFLETSLRDIEKQHTIANLPRIALFRVPYFLLSNWDAPLYALALTIVGLVVAPNAVLVGVATVGAIFIGYLAHPTWPDWTIYYMEGAPVLAFLTACGLAQLCGWLARVPGDAFSWRRMAQPTIAIAVGSLFFLVAANKEVAILRDVRESNESYQGRIRTMIARVPSPAVLFVKYGPRHPPNLTLITNGPDWPTAPVWVVADRGRARNAELLSRAPDRKGLMLDEARETIFLYTPSVTP